MAKKGKPVLALIKLQIPAGKATPAPPIGPALGQHGVGIMDFCKTCKKCAEACPPAALSIEDEPTWEVEGPWSNFGHKAFFEDSIKCRTYWKEKPGTNCGICFAVCPYSKDNKVWMHSWAQGFVSKFPFLNKYFRNLDDAFSYGAMKSVEEWWDLDLPEYGINTERVVED